MAVNRDHPNYTKGVPRERLHPCLAGHPSGINRQDRRRSLAVLRKKDREESRKAAHAAYVSEQRDLRRSREPRTYEGRLDRRLAYERQSGGTAITQLTSIVGRLFKFGRTGL